MKLRLAIACQSWSARRWRAWGNSWCSWVALPSSEKELVMAERIGRMTTRCPEIEDTTEILTTSELVRTIHNRATKMSHRSTSMYEQHLFCRGAWSLSSHAESSWWVLAEQNDPEDKEQASPTAGQDLWQAEELLSSWYICCQVSTKAAGSCVPVRQLVVSRGDTDTWWSLSTRIHFYKQPSW